jgi:hypothetical protein
MYSVLNCHNVTRYARFYLGLFQFNVIATGNAVCFKKSFTILKTYLNLFSGHAQCFELS